MHAMLTNIRDGAQVHTSDQWTKRRVEQGSEATCKEAEGHQHNEDDEREHQDLPQTALPPRLPQCLPVHLQHCSASNPSFQHTGNLPRSLPSCQATEALSWRAHLSALHLRSGLRSHGQGHTYEVLDSIILWTLALGGIFAASTPYRASLSVPQVD